MGSGRLRRSVAALALVTAGLGLFLARSAVNHHAARGGRAGTTTCLSCHDAHGGFTGTAHHLTSQVAEARTIAGSFAEPENVLETSNPYLRFRMDSTEEGFFQTAVMGAEPWIQTRSERIDLVVGSARKGQTYLSWSEDTLLVQLPVSFWRGAGWVNSPGYRDGFPNFGRPVTPRCLECHATHFERLSHELEAHAYDPDSPKLGIGCESCHGAGAVHVQRQGSWTRWVLGQAIIDPDDLSRIRQIEACALCHRGVNRSRAAPFSYVPGDPLREHLYMDPLRPTPPMDPAGPGPYVDVHGDQVALLVGSACFQGSEMRCSTCHDVHRLQRQTSEFVPTCLQCHQVESCGLFPARGRAIADDCVDCHMPLLPSQTILSASGGETLQPRVRTHRIAIYPPGPR